MVAAAIIAHITTPPPILRRPTMFAIIDNNHQAGEVVGLVFEDEE